MSTQECAAAHPDIYELHVGAFDGVVPRLDQLATISIKRCTRSSQRKREIGIRISVGARPAQAAWTVVGDVGLFVIVGVAGGIAVALSLSSLIRGLLFGIHRTPAHARQ